MTKGELVKLLEPFEDSMPVFIYTEEYGLNAPNAPEAISACVSPDGEAASTIEGYPDDIRYVTENKWQSQLERLKTYQLRSIVKL